MLYQRPLPLYGRNGIVYKQNYNINGQSNLATGDIAAMGDPIPKPSRMSMTNRQTDRPRYGNKS